MKLCGRTGWELLFSFALPTVQRRPRDSLGDEDERGRESIAASGRTTDLRSARVLLRLYLLLEISLLSKETCIYVYMYISTMKNQKGVTRRTKMQESRPFDTRPSTHLYLCIFIYGHLRVYGSAGYWRDRGESEHGAS